MSKVWIALGVVVVAVFAITSGQQSERAKEAEAAQAAKSPAQLAAEKAEKAKRDVQIQMAGAGAQTLKNASKDPQAFQLTSLIVKPNGVACYEYRAKNSFGAELPGSAVLSGGKLLIHEQDGNAFVSAWNKSCTQNGGDDITRMIKRLI